MEISTKKSRKKYIISFLILLILIGVTFYILFKEYSIKDVKNAFSLINPNYIYYSIMMLLVYLFFEALSMKALLNKLGHKTSILSNIKYASVDVYFSAITPSALGGQPMVAYYMEKDKIPVSESSVVLLLNSIIFRIVLMVYGFIAIIISGFYLDTPVKIILFTIGLSLNVVFISIFLMALISRKLLLKIGKSIIRFLHKIKILKKDISIYNDKLESSIVKYKEAFLYLQKDIFLLIRIFTYNFIQRGAMFLIPYLVYLSFGFTTESFITLMTIKY
ncbi:conserved hypothetical protein [Alteracholeplasma palmae J233]|uniref:Phosphatidylglycerol lysyltransferase n=1 Tax=Alteracholeplasma palmae (strain ATCC 49389 / J233) TaxID=1318466 RepID=U4KQQ4_ALTPJ|nr:lysylphosphatidylglycerol synthase transmembrane domain-containing protein [Alteracholeplasma palmae]CCV64985.1 conserved hypothetical protein [Alteracholeplasma palmae J233]